MNLIRRYFTNRKAWGVHTARLLRKQSKSLQKNWSRILYQKIQMETDSISIEKDSDIKLLKEELKDKKEEIKYLKKTDLETEKLRNELQANIEHIHFHNKLLEEVQSQLSIRIGMNDSVIRNSEKLLNKEVKDV